jgi:hypothetical protein
LTRPGFNLGRIGANVRSKGNEVPGGFRERQFSVLVIFEKNQQQQPNLPEKKNAYRISLANYRCFPIKKENAGVSQLFT